MNIQEIIFQILSDTDDIWVRYNVYQSSIDSTELIEIRSTTISTKIFEILLSAAFKPEHLYTEKIDGHPFAKISFSRKYVNAKGTTATP